MTSQEWKAVIRDWYDGSIDQRHRCAAVREAIAHLPISTYSTALQDLQTYEETVC
jgi:hypothetical protein